ncbi:MAG: hypothetical protein Q7S71_01245 [Candidatus Nitrotoga sp.]|nr:hypothetical protein [Candidatus Nitrotoga sp.]
MRYLKIIVILLLVSLIGGCSNLKLLAPESFGLSPITHNIYVEDGADEGTKAKLRGAIEEAESAIRATYGDVKSRPSVYACISEDCYKSFGGMGSRAKVYGDHILLSPRGLNWHFLAHEWSHAEMSTRLTFTAWWRMPQWFDEGVAVAISEAPEHSESHWQYLIAHHIPRPTREELLTYKSLREWLDAVHRFGETQNTERKAKGEPVVAPLYTAAGHELRPWLAKAGSPGLLAFIERLNGGEKFESAYIAANNAVERDTPQAALPLATRPSP